MSSPFFDRYERLGRVLSSSEKGYMHYHKWKIFKNLEIIKQKLKGNLALIGEIYLVIAIK